MFFLAEHTLNQVNIFARKIYFEIIQADSL